MQIIEKEPLKDRYDFSVTCSICEEVEESVAYNWSFQVLIELPEEMYKDWMFFQADMCQACTASYKKHCDSFFVTNARFLKPMDNRQIKYWMKDRK